MQFEWVDCRRRHIFIQIEWFFLLLQKSHFVLFQLPPMNFGHVSLDGQDLVIHDRHLFFQHFCRFFHHGQLLFQQLWQLFQRKVDKNVGTQIDQNTFVVPYAGLCEQVRSQLVPDCERVILVGDRIEMKA